MSSDQILAAIGTFLATYIFYQALGTRDTSLFFSREQKATWDANIKEGLGRWLVITGIFATLTGFATYLFLLGSTKLFGLFALSTGLTIAISAPVTRGLTRPFLEDERIAKLFADNDQVSSVIATLFWSPSKDGQNTALLVKWISLFVIVSVIWLECTAFVDLTFWVSGHTKPDEVLPWRFAIMTGVAFAIIFFVLRYGIRGFVFADLLHTPVIGVAAVTLLLGTIWLTHDRWSSVSFRDFVSPILADADPGTGLKPGWIFAAHVLILNLFQITCTEHHWFRMWLFGENELGRQFRGTAMTGLIWLLMLPVGFMAFMISGAPGEAAIGALVPALSDLFPWFGLIFWIGATAALFSTADMQIYSALLVSRFEPRTGSLHEISLSPLKSLLWASLIAVSFGVLYTGARAASLPLEKIIFTIVPMCTVLLPAFLHYKWGRVVKPWVLAFSSIGYVAMITWGFLIDKLNFSATLSAVFVPVAVALLTVFFVPLRGQTNGGGSEGI